MAAKAVADIVRTTLGPSSMMKMLLDPNGSIVLTNDGRAILREIDVAHPAAKSVIELSRAQDEEVGDGTTSVIILAGEILHLSYKLLEDKIHPTVVCLGLRKALEAAMDLSDSLSFEVDIHSDEQMIKVIDTCIGTKFTNRFGSLIPGLALEALRTVTVKTKESVETDIKNYAKVEKIAGGSIEESKVLRGVMFAKDVVTPGRMARRIENPRILLLDCPLEYKKGENQTNVELTKEQDWQYLLQQEEDNIKEQINQIAQLKPDIVITEKGLSDVAAHFLIKNNISAIRRVRKTDNNRIARATGATIMNRTDSLREEHLGIGAGLFEVVKINDEYWTCIVDCKEPKACTIVLRGPSRETINEYERNLMDAMMVAKNIMQSPKIVCGAGAYEMAVSKELSKLAGGAQTGEKGAFNILAKALEVIPRTLCQNCGCNIIRTMTKLRAKHNEDSPDSIYYGVEGNTGDIANIQGGDTPIWEPIAVKIQTIKTAVEASILLLRIDDIVSGITKRGGGNPQLGQKPQPEDHENVDSERMIPE